MTERARRIVGGDDCQNRAARRYEKCSYLWHYFRRFEPSLLLFRPFPRPSLSPPYLRLLRRRASRIALPCPFTPLPRPRPDLPPYLPTAVVSRSARRSYFLSSRVACSPRVLLPPPSCPPSSSPPDRPTTRPVEGPTTSERAQRGDCPHRRGHYFNVTLIKSNNQYLPRKKF